MVRFYIDELEIFFPYDYIYPEQYDYMKRLKSTLDAKGHCVLEMPTGTGKTVALLSLITSYQMFHPEIRKLIYCTRTVPEMEKVLLELKIVFAYQLKELESEETQPLSATSKQNNISLSNQNTVRQASDNVNGVVGNNNIIREEDVKPLCTYLENAKVAKQVFAKAEYLLKNENKEPPFAAPSSDLTNWSTDNNNTQNHDKKSPSYHGDQKPNLGENAKVSEHPESVLPSFRRSAGSRLSRHRRFLGLGMTSRRNLCIHPEIAQEANRDKVDELCQRLTAPWIRNQRTLATTRRKAQETRSTDIEDLTQSGCSVEGACSLCPENSNKTTTDSGSEPPPVCPYYENLELYWSPSLMESKVFTIEEMKTWGTLWKKPNSADVPAPVCPYFTARRLLNLANVIVLNYQYILDPKVSQVAFMSGIGPAGITASSTFQTSDSDRAKDPSIVVFDEAHNIDNVCIEAFSININTITLEKARRGIIQLERLINETKVLNSSRLLEEYNRLVQNLKTSGQLDDLAVESLSNPVIPDDIVRDAVPGNIRRAELFLATMKRLIFFLTTYIRVFTVKTEGPLTFLKTLKDDTNVDPKTLKFCYERLRSLINTLQIISLDEFAPLILCANFFTLLGTYWEGFIIIIDPYPEAEGVYDPLIQLSCLDSSLAMKPVIQKFQSIVLTSGTISPLFLYPKLLGFHPVITQSLPMSLDRDCICPLIIAKGADQVPLSSRFDLRSDPAVLRNFGTLLVELSKTVPDGLVCFFTSYVFMECIVAEWYSMGFLAQVLRYKLIFMETKDVVATTLALHSFRKACDCGRGGVFFSVARGKVAEGIDFDRHYGRAVVLFGVPYQYTLSRILKARLDFMRENHQVQENEFLTFDAMRQAAQCVGRIIRSKADYGLMIFADCRYSRLDKREKLPEWILRHLDPAHIALSTDAALALAKRFLLDMSQPLRLTHKSRLDAAALAKL